MSDSRKAMAEDEQVLRVRLVYFKRSGKYYTEGKFETLGYPYTMSYLYDYVQKLRRRGVLPGLACGAGKEFIILVQIVSHPEEPYALILPEDEVKEEDKGLVDTEKLHDHNNASGKEFEWDITVEFDSNTMCRTTYIVGPATEAEVESGVEWGNNFVKIRSQEGVVIYRRELVLSVRISCRGEY